MLSSTKLFSKNFSNVSHSIKFLLNGKVVNLEQGSFDPTESLVSYLRSEKVNLKGTKRGCEEGGCGCCTVIMSSYDPVLRRVKHRAINSCLMPLGNIHNTSITTIEKLSSNPNKLNPIQEAIKNHHATQCGFCTPGFIMSALAMLLEKPNPTNQDILYYMDGNLCRCTGYRSILEAIREFTVDVKPNDQEISHLLKGEHSQKVEKAVSVIKNKVLDEKMKKELNNDHQSVIIPFKNRKYYIPSSLEELIQIKKENPHAKLIVGNTELFVSNIGNDDHDFVSTHLVKELQYITIENAINQHQSILKIGASTPLDDIYEICEHSKDRVLKAMKNKIETFASNQTRNVACLTGNIVTAGGSTDFTNFLPGVDAKIKIINCLTGESRVSNLDNFFIQRLKSNLQPHEIITEILIPLSDSRGEDHCFTYKTSIRREIAGCILSATIRASINEKNNRIEKIRIAFSNIDQLKPHSRAIQAEEFLLNKEFTIENINEAINIINHQEFLNPKNDDGYGKYRQELVGAYLIKFFHETEKERSRPFDQSIVDLVFSNKVIPENSVICQCDNSKTTVPLSRVDTVGKSVTHLSAPIQVMGKAEYTDDIPLTILTKHAAFVSIKKAYAKIKSIHIPEEIAQNPNVTIITHKDLLPGTNVVGSNDEEFLATDKVTYFGQPVAIVVADDEKEAWRIADLIQVDYEPLPAIATIEDAIAHNKCFKGDTLVSGCQDIDSEFFKNSHDGLNIIEGQINMGGQFYFYIEPNAGLTNHSSDGQYFITATCRDLETIRAEASTKLGIPRSYVQASVKRIGGAFCGKTLRTTLVTSATAIASKLVECPVKMRLPRTVDTHIAASDHQTNMKYKVSYDSNGRIHAVKLDFYVDCGYSYKSTKGFATKTLMHSDNSYNIPNLTVNTYLCQTNKVSASPFRGYGCQYGNLGIDCVLEIISRKLKKSPDEVKRINFYKSNDISPLNINLGDVCIDECWSFIKKQSKYEELVKCVRAFNHVNKYKKRGISIVPCKYGVGFPNDVQRRGSALVHLQKDGTIYLSHSGVEVGQGLHTKMSQLAAKIFEVPVDAIRIENSDTTKNTEVCITGSGFTNDLVGFAVIDACTKLRKSLEPFYHQNKTFQEIVNEAINHKIDITAHGYYSSEQKGYDLKTKTGRPHQYYEYGAGVSLVEIDVLTGEYQTLESHITFDAGQSLNPGIDIGQAEGGFIQGVGWLTTEISKSKPDGSPFNDSMYKYKIPTITALPHKFSCSLLPNSHNKIGVIDSKGIGEPPEVLGNSVGLAIYDAIQTIRSERGLSPLQNYEFPITVERVRMLIRQ